jgi:hypothetical protein
MKNNTKNYKAVMKARIQTLTGIVLALAINPAFAADIYDANGFESPPFAEGSPLVGQDGWVGVPILSPNAALISTDLPFTGLQSVQVRGVNLEHQDFINEVTEGYYDAIGSYRRPVNFNVTANGFSGVRIQTDVRIDGPVTRPGAASHACVFSQADTQLPSIPCNNFFSASIAARGANSGGGTTGIGELAISSDGQVYGYSGNDDVPKFLTSHPVSLGAWHTLAVDVDFIDRTYSFSVDGKSLPGGPFPFVSTADTSILARGSLIAYAAPETSTLKKSNYLVHFDNFSITSQ